MNAVADCAMHAANRALAVTARGLARSFGSAPVLRGLDLHVPAGQFLAMVGRSGSGKSTLLRLLGGIDRPDAGRVSLGERGRPGDARIMFQEPRLLPWATVLANVAVELGPVGRADEWLAGLSGGQKSRVALARALVSRPRLLMLDEPLGALDALTRIEMQDLVQATRRQAGFTAVLVTHDVSEAVALADCIVVIEDGALTMDVAVDLPPHDRRGSAQVAAVARVVLDRLLGHDDGGERRTIVLAKT